MKINKVITSFLIQRNRNKHTGFTLTELLVAMLLGVLILIAVSSLFFSSHRTHRTTDAVSRIQEQQRLAFELMARDIRHAGSFPCKGMDDVVWLDGSAASSDFPEPRYLLTHALVGNMDEERWDGDPSQRKRNRAGFDSVALVVDPAINNGKTLYPVIEHRRPNANLKVLNLDKSGFDKAGYNKYLIICNAETAIVFSATSISGDTIHIVPGMSHNNICGGGFTRKPNIAPMSMDCDKSEPVGPGYCFWGDMTVIPTEEDKVACDEIGQSQAYLYSLPRLALRPDPWFVDEKHNLWGGQYGKVAEGVIGLQLRYRLKGSKYYLDAKSISAKGERFDFSKRKGGSQEAFNKMAVGSFSDAWGKVDSVHLKMTFQSPDNIGTDGKPLERTMETYIAIRSRMPEIYNEYLH